MRMLFYSGAPSLPISARIKGLLKARPRTIPELSQTLQIAESTVRKELSRNSDQITRLSGSPGRGPISTYGLTGQDYSDPNVPNLHDYDFSLA